VREGRRAGAGQPIRGGQGRRSLSRLSRAEAIRCSNPSASAANSRRRVLARASACSTSSATSGVLIGAPGDAASAEAADNIFVSRPLSQGEAQRGATSLFLLSTTPQ